MARKRKRPQDPKEEALEAHGALNPRAGEVRDEQFRRGGFFDPRDLVQVKYEMLRRNLSDGWSATATAQAYGFSRATFYATKEAYDREGLLGLLPKKPGPRGPHKLTGEVLEFVERLLAKKPDLDSQGLVEEIQAKFDLRVHRRSVERALARSSASGKKSPADATAQAVVSRYEDLRRGARVAPADGSRGLGLALFLQRGMAAWIAVWTDCCERRDLSAKPKAGASSTASGPPGLVDAEVVTILANMTLALVGVA